ncbi:NADH-quinone oxidoreductase subunit C [Chloroflexota bacterium]
MNVLGAKAVVQSFDDALNGALVGSRIYEREVGVKKHVYTSLWVDVERDGFRPAILHLCQLHEMPHFSVISQADLGDSVDLLYHFSLYTGEPNKAIALVIRVTLPKADLTIPTITDVVPGAIFSERETQEMMGVTVVGIPDDRRLFIPDDFPQGVYPWRRDETGPEQMLKVLPGKQGIQHE